MNCPNCGAAVKEGKFCNYCGAKLPDDTKRVEVNINKRIEDIAEVRRADYETQESLLRQKKMKRDLRKGRAKLIVCSGLAAIGGILLLLDGQIKVIGGVVWFFLIVYLVISWINK